MTTETNSTKIYLAVAFTAIVTTIASITVNKPIYSYLNRAQPNLSITSVGFAGPIGNESIKVPLEMVR